MTIKAREAPAANAAVLSKGLNDVAPLRGRESLLGGSEVAATMRPIPLYSVGLDNLAEGMGLEGAEQIGWRYLVYGTQAVGIADLDDKGGEGAPRFSAFSEGERAKCLNSALKYAEDKYQSGDNIYDVRILEIPSLYSTAVWLAGNSNIFIPFMDNGKLCQIGSVDQEQFLSELINLASKQRQLLHDDDRTLDEGYLEPH